MTQFCLGVGNALLCQGGQISDVRLIGLLNIHSFNKI